MTSSLLTTLIIGAMLWIWARSAKQAPEVLPHGAIRVAYPPVLLGFGALLAVLGLGLTVAMLVSFSFERASEVWVVVVIAGVIAALVVPILLESRRWVLMDERGLEGHFPGWAPVFIGWQEVSGARFSKWSGYLTLTTDDGRKVRVSPFMRGGAPLADLVREHRVAGADEAVAAFHDMRQKYGA